MNLTQRVNEDIKEAMKNKDKEKLNVIRMLKSSIQMTKIELKHELTDEEVIKIISKQIKMRKDSIEEFSRAKREDLINQYQKEIDILTSYMPEQLSLDEVNKIITQAFEKIKPTTQKQMGLIMKEVSPKINGRYDMKEISNLIKDKLKEK